MRSGRRRGEAAEPGSPTERSTGGEGPGNTAEKEQAPDEVEPGVTRPDTPTALAHAVTSEPALADADLDNATYFLSRATLALGRSHGMAMWRKHLFLLLAHNAANPGHTFALPPKRTIVMGSEIEI